MRWLGAILALLLTAPACAMVHGGVSAPLPSFALKWSRPTLVSPKTITVSAGNFSSTFWVSQLTASITGCPGACLLTVSAVDISNLAKNWFLADATGAGTLVDGCAITSLGTGTGGTGTYNLNSTCSNLSSQAISAAPDCTVVWPGSTHNGYAEFNGCHNLVSIGGDATITPQGADLSNSAPSRLFYIKEAIGTVSVEGFYGHTGGSTSGDSMVDFIDIAAPLATVQVQNSRCEGLYGYFLPVATPPPSNAYAFHADVIQVFGGAMALKVHSLTCYTAYQGIDVFSDQAPVGSADLENVNIGVADLALFGNHNNGGFVLWTTPNNTCSPTPTIVSNFYIVPRPNNNLLSQSVYGTSGCALVVAPDGNSATGGTLFAGVVYKGLPPRGDFVPANRVGLNYPSGGY